MILNFEEFINQYRNSYAYDVYVSLGFNCYTSMVLRRCFLQYQSYPFDWSRGIDEEKAGILGFERKIDLICNDFNRWIDKDDLILINENKDKPKEPHMDVRNNYTGLQYTHDFKKGKKIEEGYNDFFLKYQRRKERLQALMNKNDKKINNVFYAGMKFINDDLIVKNYHRIKNKYPEANFDFCIIQNNPYMDKDSISLEQLDDHVKKITLFNYDFDEKIQGSYDIVSPRLLKCLSIFKPRKRIIHNSRLAYTYENIGEFGIPYNDFDGMISYGPYFFLPKGEYCITISYTCSPNYSASYDICSDYAKFILKEGIFDQKASKILIDLELKEDTSNIEIRTYGHPIKKESQNSFFLKEILISSKEEVVKPSTDDIHKSQLLLK